jgi:hypothetical protein
MFEFMSKNQRAIDALTIKDVIYGEIEDSVPKVNDIEDLLSINQVEFKVLSAEEFRQGRDSATRPEQARRVAHNAMLARMVELARLR